MDKFIKGIKDFFGESNEFVASTNMALEERISSPFYGYFIISWIIWNWWFLYVAIIVDQENIFEKTKLLKNDYLDLIIPPHYSFEFWFNFFIMTLLLTFFFFWLSPYITRPFHRKNIRNRKALKVIELQETREEKEEQKELVQVETDLIQKEVEKAKQEKIAETEAPEVLWEKEYKVFRDSRMFTKFNQIIDSIYTRYGRISWNNTTYVETDILVYADSVGLIEITQNNSRSIELTTKGKFFVRKYTEEKNRIHSSK